MSGRIRTIKPEWLEDERMGAASDAARLLSIALILMADDHGRGRASIAHVASCAWAYELEREDGAKARETLAKASRALRELHESGFVTLYEVSGQRYFEIRKWKQHQKVDKPGKERVPAPIVNDSATAPAIPETLARPSRDPRETLATDPDPRPRSPTPDPEGIRAGAREADPPAPDPSSAHHLHNDAETIRKAVAAAFTAAGVRPAPTAVRDIGGKPWLALVEPMREVARVEGADLARVAARLGTGFVASPRARKAHWPIAWLTANPGEYLAPRNVVGDFSHVDPDLDPADMLADD